MRMKDPHEDPHEDLYEGFRGDGERRIHGFTGFMVVRFMSSMVRIVPSLERVHVRVPV